MSNKNQENRQDWNWEELWKGSFETEERVAHSFDRWMITLSGGAMGLSITFIQHIAPHPVKTWMLMFAWSGFTAALLCMLVSLLTSQVGLRRYRKLIEKRMAGPDAAGDDIRNPFARTTDLLNWASAILFVLGVIMMAWFSIENLP